MADKRISDLTSASSLTLADLLVLVNDSQTKKTTVEDLLNLIISQETFAQLDINGNIPLELLPESLSGAVIYQTSWNANTNTPALPAADPENKGWYYVVSTDGTTNVNGITEWKVGDWVISNGSVWQKVDNTDAVSSWNSRLGAVVPETGDYDTDMVEEGSTNLYYTAARVLAQVLAGLVVENEEVISSDSILTAIGKLQGQIDATVALGAVTYKGTWNATGATTSTALNLTSTAAAAENKGWYFVVSTSGNTSVGGVSEWKVGDWVISNGTAWQKADNSETVTKVFNRTGDVVAQSGDYNTSQVTENTNLYYTQARVRAETLGTVTPANAAIATGDSIATAFNRAQGQINALAGSVMYKGGWNAAGTATTGTVITITTTAASASNKGWYFVVTGDGNTSVGGITEWKVGDWVISNGTAWQKVDNSESVTTVFGRSGDVVAQSGDYNTSQVTENTNLYYTGARVRSEVITGMNPISGTISASDTIVQAFSKTAGALPAKENTANKGMANGYASLDSNGKLPITQLTNLGTVTPANTAIATGDSISVAFNRAQGQINAKESTANKGVASGYASLDSNTRLPKGQLTRGQTAIDMDFAGWSQNNSTETLKYSFQIPAGVFAAGDQLNIDAWIGGANTANAKTVKIYFNTSSSLSGATAIGTYTFTTGVMSVKMSREVSFLTNTTMKCGVLPATSSVNGESTSVLDSTATTIPSVSAGFYVIISLKGFTGFPSGDTAYLDRVVLKGLYA